MVKTYEGIMRKFGAKKDGWAEPDSLFRPSDSQNQRLWRAPNRPKKTKIGSANFDDWFEPAADGNGYTLGTGETNPYSADPAKGGGEKSRATKRLSNAELWKRKNSYINAHFIAQNSPGFGGLRDIADNSGFGKRIPDSIMGGANTFDNMLDVQSKLDTGLLSGTIDKSGEAEYRAWVDDMREILGKDGINHPASLKELESFKPEFVSHPLKGLPEDAMRGLVSTGSQPSDKLLSGHGYALNRSGEALPGNERSVATLHKELIDGGMPEDIQKFRDGTPDKTHVPEGKPFALKPEDTTRSTYERGLKRTPPGRPNTADPVMERGMLGGLRRPDNHPSRVPPKQGGYVTKDMLKRLGKGALKGGGLLGLYAAPEIMANVIAPEANQKGRKKAEELGSMLNTDNWFDGRDGLNEDIIRFAGSMLADPLYTYGGIALEDLERNKARGSRESRRRTKTGMRGRFGNKGTGLISGG